MEELDEFLEDESYSDDSLLNLISYGIDLTVREIVTMLDENDLVIPSLQRNYVWNKKEASRFIDSVLLGLPVPSLFLAKDSDERLLIVDGLQRIRTLHDYLQGTFSGDNTRFRLSNNPTINDKWRNMAFNDLTPELQRRIRNYSIHAIIFDRKDKRGKDTAMYQIFERINTGGRVLTHQEIRNCVYHGSFNDLLIELSQNEQWIGLIGGKNDVRMKNAELILRCFAIKEMISLNLKVANLNKYLNEYMSNNQNIDVEQTEFYRSSFFAALDFVSYAYGYLSGSNVFKTSLPLIESLMVSFLIVSNEKNIDKTNFDFKNVDSLLADEQYKNASLARTTNVMNIKTRISRCLTIVFGDSGESGI